MKINQILGYMCKDMELILFDTTVIRFLPFLDILLLKIRVILYDGMKRN